MNISITEPLIGGLLIGLSSSITLLFLGKITGVSGILSGSFFYFFEKKKKTESWKILFLLGLFLGGVITKAVNPSLFNYEIKTSFLKLIIAGILVGFGTRLGSGCTSGHGVCGLPRFSMRSLGATIIFMSTGIITVFLLRFL